MEKIKILIPTDFSVQAEYAYLLVKNLQSKMPMDIHFLHVLSVPDTVTMDATGKIETCGEIDVSYVEKQQQIALRNLANYSTAYGSETNTHLLLGKVTDTILKFSEEQKIDLIVMGTKGAWGLKEKLSGSEAQMVARRSPTPVLSLMCDRSDLQIRNILMVHDFNKPSDENLNLLKKLVRAFSARVHLLQITSGDTQVEQSSATDNMKSFAAINGIENFDCHLLKDSDVEAGVVHFNQINEMDIVFIGTYGKGGLLHQSATEKLINHLFKPIISFHLKN